MDIKAQLDTLIYASARIEMDDLYKLRHLVQKKYGVYYIQAADQNRDGLVNVNVIEKLTVRPASSTFVTIRLRQLCKEKKLNYEFPDENFDGMGNNPYDNNGMGNPHMIVISVIIWEEVEIHMLQIILEIHMIIII